MEFRDVGVNENKGRILRSIVVFDQVIWCDADQNEGKYKYRLKVKEGL